MRNALRPPAVRPPDRSGNRTRATDPPAKTPLPGPVCVYAVIRGPGRGTFRLGGQRFDLLRSGTLAAVIRAAPRSMPPSPARLRRYDRVVRALARSYPAILPVRYGTCLSVDELRLILTSRRSALSDALAHVRGRLQMTVRVVHNRPVSEPAPARERTRAMSGREYLRERARQAARERVVPGFEAARRLIARWVRDERVEHSNGVSTIYHLIPRASADVYRGTVERAAAAADVRVVVTGPWPPYAFSVLE